MDNEISIIGCGVAFPKKCVSNFDLEKDLDTTDEWIFKRTGIKTRYIVSGDETTATLGFEASVNALNNANMDSSEIDIIILATSTPDDIFPASAIKIQKLLNAKNAVSFDINSACSGFVFALETACNFLKTGNYKNALVIGADTYSKIVDWNDRSTCVLFGDGAGAFVISNKINNNPKIIKSNLFSDPSNYELLVAKHCQAFSKFGSCFGKIEMNGKEVYKAGIFNMIHAIKGLGVSSIDKIIPHQANLRMIESIATHMNFDIKNIVTNVSKYANTSSATIPTAYHQAKINKGDNVVLVSMGAGFSYGAILIQG